VEHHQDLAAVRELTIAAGGGTDHFIDPATCRATLNAPRVLAAAAATADFQLSARVDVDFESTFDAGALLLWADDLTWAKLCLEYSPQARAMVVSVVTRGLSDDANAVTVDVDQTWLRVSRTGGSYAFHCSADGRHWDMVRHFALPAERAAVRAGFSAQSPTGAGCVAHFTQVRFVETPVADLRDGT